MSEILVSIVKGSDSDLEGMKKAGQILDKFSVGEEMSIISTHRTPGMAHEHAI